MLVITAYIEVTDREAIRAPLLALLTATRTEDGCDEYGCYEDTEHPGRYVFVERWRDKAALDRHVKMPHFVAWMQAARPLLKSAVGTLFEIAGQTPLRP